MSLTTEIDSTSNHNLSSINHTIKQINSKILKKFETTTDSSVDNTQSTTTCNTTQLVQSNNNNNKQQLPDSGISSDKTNNSILKSKKLPLKITQDDNRLTINLETTNSLKRPSRSKSDHTTPTTTTTTNSISTSNSNNNNNKTKNENLIRIIKENIEPVNKLQPCDLFLIPLLKLSDYGTDFLKLKENNELLIANLVKTTTTTTTTTNRKSKLITTTTNNNNNKNMTEITTENQQQTTTSTGLQHSSSFLAEFANKFHLNKMLKTNSNNSKTKTGTPHHRNLKELIGEAGDLSHLFMPIVQLAEIDLDRKKSNRLKDTFKQVTESYRRNRKLSKEPSPLPKQTDLIPETTATTADDTTLLTMNGGGIDKSKSLVNLNQIVNRRSSSSSSKDESNNNSSSSRKLTAPGTAPTKKKLNNFLKQNKENTTSNNSKLLLNAPNPPPRTHSIPGYSMTRDNDDDNNNNDNKKLKCNNQDLLATRLTFSTNTSMDLNNSDVYTNSNNKVYLIFKLLRN
jgi:hypothetical protein